MNGDILFKIDVNEKMLVGMKVIEVRPLVSHLDTIKKELCFKIKDNFKKHKKDFVLITFLEIIPFYSYMYLKGTNWEQTLVTTQKEDCEGLF